MAWPGIQVSRASQPRAFREASWQSEEAMAECTLVRECECVCVWGCCTTVHISQALHPGGKKIALPMLTLNGSTPKVRQLAQIPRIFGTSRHLPRGWRIERASKHAKHAKHASLQRSPSRGPEHAVAVFQCPEVLKTRRGGGGGDVGGGPVFDPILRNAAQLIQFFAGVGSFCLKTGT